MESFPPTTTTNNLTLGDEKMTQTKNDHFFDHMNFEVLCHLIAYVLEKTKK